MSDLLKSVPPGRLVAILTPLLFAPLAGLIVLQVGKIGIDLPKDQVEKAIIELVVFVVGALIAYLKSRQWLKGAKEWEQLEEKAAVEIEVAEITAAAASTDAVVDPETELSPEELAALEAEALTDDDLPETEEFETLDAEPDRPAGF